MKKRWLFTVCTCFGCLLSVGPLAANAAVVTDLGTVWDSEPDAWTRGNDANTSYFGWDDFTPDTAVPLNFGRVLDDSTPDLGTGITATGIRVYQGTDGINDPSPSPYGHVSGSNNYYSGFVGGAVADDTFTATTPASGSGGFTTVVLQVLGQGAGLDDLTFAMDNSTDTWTKQKDLYGVDTAGSGLVWQEWTAAGAGLTFSIDMDSTFTSQAIDAVQIDTYWSPNAPAVNSLTFVGVPEPSTFAMVGLGVAGMVALAARRRFDAGSSRM